MAVPSSTPFKGGDFSTEWIDTQARLTQFCGGASSAVGFDTEFVRTRTFFPQAGLYQIYANQEVALVDPLADIDFEPLQALLRDEHVVKIMHACTEDLELVSHDLAEAPTRIFDTQLAYAFVSTNFSASYAKVVNTLLGVELDKQETRSNWRQRPLTERQKTYAALDVVHLIPLFEKLTEQLVTLGRLHWFEEDMLARGRYQSVAPEVYYQTVRKAWRMDVQELGRLQSLCRWREYKARSEDVPRNRVVFDDHLIEFALRGQLTITQVQNLLPGKVGARYGQEIVAAHDAAGPVDGLLEPPLSQRQGEVLKKIRAFAVAKAESLGFAVELLARKRDLEALIRSCITTGEWTPVFLGWRKDVLGPQFKTLIEQEVYALR